MGGVSIYVPVVQRDAIVLPQILWYIQVILISHFSFLISHFLEQDKDSSTSMCHLIQAPASPNKKQAPSPLPVFILHVCTQVQASKQHSIASFNSQRARETYPTQTRPNFWRELSRNMLVHVSPHGMNHKPRKPAGAVG